MRVRIRPSLFLTAVALSGVTAMGGLAGASPAQAASHTGPAAGARLAPVYYEVLARHSRKCVDVTGASYADGARVIQYTCHNGRNQQWRLVQVAPGYYELVVRHSGKCLDVTGASRADGTQVIQYRCHRGTNQQWRLVQIQRGWYELVARHSGKCLDVTGASYADGTRIIQYRCHRGTNQQFGFAPVGY